MKSISTIIVLFFLLFLQSCSEKDRECDIICTEEYRTIIVSVQDGEGEPVALDDFKVVDVKNDRDLTIQPTADVLHQMKERGTYLLFSDRYVQEYAQQELEINFTGFIDGEEVLNEDYVVGADCCHVYHVSGDLELELR